MPFKSDKQREYFFAKLNSLPKGSEEYKKWKKVVDKFAAHSVDESQELDEARRNPEMNIEQPVAKQIEQFVDKYKGQEELIFISFRDDVYVTFINPKNVYGTPTGIYTYPWLNFYDDKFKKYVKDYLVANVGKNIPFAGERKYMFIYKLKSNQGVLTNQTTYNDTLPYANKLLNLVKNNQKALEIVNTYINDYERYITDYYNDNDFANSYFGDVHTFWVLLYLVGDRITKGKTQDTIGNLCRAIGVNGFVDFDGKGYIHGNERYQAVFFRGRELFDDIKIINTLQSGNKIYNRNLFDYINNKEFIENLDADRVQNLLSNAPNNEFLTLIIDTLLSNKNFVSNIDGLIFTRIIYYAKMIDKSAEKIDRIIDIVLSNKNFLDVDINDKIQQLLRYAPTNEKRISIINTLLNNENYVDKIDSKGIKYIIEYSPSESNYYKDEIIKYIVNNNKTTSKIDENNISYLFNNTSREYRTELINILLKRDDIVNNYNNVINILYQSPERSDEIVDALLQNKSFLSYMQLELGYSNPKVIDFLGDSQLLSESSKQKMVNKMIEIRPDIVEKLFMDGNINKFILILRYSKINLDSIINNLNPKYSETNYGLYAVLINLSNPKTFVKERIGVERMKKFFENYDYDFMIDNAKNKKEIAELIMEYTGKDYSNRIETPINEIFNSLTSLQEELKKQKNIEKVKQFLLEKKGFISEDFKSQEQNYINQGFNSNIVKSYIERFRKIKDKNYKQIDSQDLNDSLKNVKDRRNIDSYKTFKELETFVDYVNGQVDLEGFSLGKDIEIDGKPYYENNVFQIYYADTPRACIKYKGTVPYSWCVSQKEGNMYYAYRYRENEPSFYFVKIKDRTKKELETFSGQFKDKYHFFVLQVNNDAEIGNTTKKQYVVTSAINDNDKPMSWDEIVAIEPRIANLQEIFKSVSINPEDRAFYDRYGYKDEYEEIDDDNNEYIQGASDKEFCKFDYVYKKKYLDMIIAGGEIKISDNQFKCSPDDLKNLFIGFGFGLSENQFELIKNNKNLFKRFKQITDRKYEEALKNNQDFKFTYSELLILPEEALLKLDLEGFIDKKDDTKKILEKANLFISRLSTIPLSNLNPINFKNLFYNISLALRIDKGKEILNVGGENLINEFINNPKLFFYFCYSNIENLTEIFNNLIDKGKKKFLISLTTPKQIIIYGNKRGSLLEAILYNISPIYAINPNFKLNYPEKVQIISKILNVGGKEFIDTLDETLVTFFIKNSENPEQVKELFQKYGKLPNDITPMNEIFNSLTSLQEELNEQNKVNIKQKNLEKVKNFLFEKKKPLLEDEFYFNSLPDDKKESIYNLFKKSYEGSVGTSWSKDKFYSRAYDWLFFGDENGFVSVRTQKSGLYKLVGVAGSLKSILNGFNELQSKNVPIWGMVSKDIQQMAHKKGFITPPPFLLKILYKVIPNSVFGNTEFDVNSDGSLTLKYSDVGDAVKYFIGNDEYFKNLKTNVLPSMKDELTKTMIDKFLPESVNTLNEEILDEDITSGNVTVYHRTGRKYGDSSVKGIAADGYTVGGGALYGVGVYTTYDLESQLQDYLRNSYGNIIIESKVLSLDKFLIFDYDIAKKIYGNVNYTLDNQLRLILGSNWKYFKDNDIIKKLIEKVTVVEYTSDVADTFYKNFTSTIVKSLRGLIFTGRNDGKVLVSYDRKNVEPLRYTTDEGETWTNIINKNIYQRLKGYKPEERETNVEHTINKLQVKPQELTDGEIKYIINNISLFLKSGVSFKSLIKAIISLSDDKKVKINYLNNVIKNNAEILIKIITFDDLKFITTEYEIPAIYSMLIFKILLKYADKNFADKLTEIYGNDITKFYRISDEKIRKLIIETIIKYNGKEFLINNFNNINTILYIFTPSGVSVKDDIKAQKLINKIISIGGKELIYKLITNTREIGNQNLTYITLLLYNVNKENFKNVFNNLIKFGGKDFVNNLDKDILWNIYYEYSDFESLTHKLLKVGGKEFIDKNRNNISTFATSYRDVSAITDIFDMYDTKQTPMNEIFKSLTSLQEELNEQNKVNVKQKNIEKVKQFLLERKGVISEDFKSQEQNFINQGFNRNIVKSYIERFRKIKDKNYRQIDSQNLNDSLKNVKDRRNIDSYKTFEELETIVDYVKGQVDLEGTSLGKDIEIDAKPIYEDDVFQIYYADSPRACIKYKGNIPYGWCVSQKEGNMYYTYRYKYNEPSFYFVKIKDRTKKELGFFNMVGNVFNGEFKDKYHFFVLQTLKGTKIGDTKTEQYIVTSAINDGDKQMSWDDIVKIEPRIANLQEIFKSVELSPEDRKFYERFKNGADDETFCKLDYTSKRRYLDIYILPPEKLLSDIQFKCLPEDLMNLYIGFGVGLRDGQFELIKNNKNLLKRYQQITEKKLEIYLKDKNERINFQYTELLILPENKRKDYLINSDLLYSDDAIEYYLTDEKYNDMIFKIGGKDFVLNIDTPNLSHLLGYSKEPDKIIDMLINIGGKDFVLEFNRNLLYNGIGILLRYSKEPDKIIDMLINIGGKDFVLELSSDSISDLLSYSSEREKIIDMLFNIGGSDFIMNLKKNSFYNLIYYSKEPDKIFNLLGDDKFKKLIMGMQISLFQNLLDKIKNYSKNPKKYKDMIANEIKHSISTTPMNEIFKSLTSLQEELNEQNKVTIKESNLMKVQNFFKNKKNNQ